MNIGEAASRSGLPAKTIRYYEEIGLVSPDRRDNGYRDYSAIHVHNLKFLARSRALGFTIDECRRLLSLYSDRQRASADVKRLARDHIATIEARIEHLQEIKATLAHLADACRGDDRPQCPILDDLAGRLPSASDQPEAAKARMAVAADD